MLVLWALLGPVGMLLHLDPANHLTGWIGQYGDEKYLSQLIVLLPARWIVAMIVASLLSKPLPRKSSTISSCS